MTTLRMQNTGINIPPKELHRLLIVSIGAVTWERFREQDWA